MSHCCHCSEEAPCAAKISIFKHLDPDSQRRISDLAVHRLVKKGEILCSPEKQTGLFLISEGRVKVYELSPDGKEKLLRVLGKGDFVGEETLFGGCETYAFSEALTQVQVCHIPAQSFLQLLQDYPSISLKLLEEFNRRLVQLSHRASAGSAGSVLSRLAGYLLGLSAAQDSAQITLPLQMKELAIFLDTTPETLSRRIRTLEEEGILSKKGRAVHILLPDALSRLAQ